VEKIGSGNWYWSFASQDRKTRQKALDEAQATHDKAASVVSDLREKLGEAEAQRADEENMLDGNGESREELVTAKAVLESELKALRKDLAAYSDNDPTELERKRKDIPKYKLEAEQYTDEIYSMEGWFKDKGQGDEAIAALRMSLYGDEYDEEEGILRELE